MYSALYNMDRNRTCNWAAQITNGGCKFWYRRTPEVKHSALKKLEANLWLTDINCIRISDSMYFQNCLSNPTFNIKNTRDEHFLLFSPPEFNIFQRYLMSNPQSKCLVPICFFEALNTDNFSLIQCFKIQKPGGKITAEKMLLVLLI